MLSENTQSRIKATRAKVARIPPWLSPFVAKLFLAITLGRRVYVSSRVAEEEMEELLRHELVHVEQIARLGSVRFYWRYIMEYITLRRRGFSSGDAYKQISFEVEAFAAEKIL